MFRRNTPVSGLQRPEGLPESAASSPASPAVGELSLHPATPVSAPMSSTPSAPPSSAPMARPLASPAPSSLAGNTAGKPAELPVSRFGGIPGVLPRRIGAPGEASGQSSSASSSSYGDASGLRKLTVGREITLSGDITTCDILMVEGNIDATLRDGKILEISEAGHFRGAAEVDEADIAGRFEGTLTVRSRLKLRATGQLEGTLSYGEIEVEAGGRLTGELKVLGAPVGAGSAKAAIKESRSERMAASSRVLEGAEG